MKLPQSVACRRSPESPQADRYRCLLLVIVFGWATWGALEVSAQPPAKPPAVAPKASAANPAPPEKGEALPPLTQKRFYEVLVADIALQRQEPILAAQTFMKLARDTKSAWFAQRATESALMARDLELLNRTLGLWQKLDPSTDKPERIRAQVARVWQDPLSRSTDEKEIRTRLESLLKEADVVGNLGEAFLQLNAFFAKRADKIAVFNTIQALALPYQKHPESHYAVALAALVVSTDRASEQKPDLLRKILMEGVQEIELALEDVPEWDEAMQLKAALLEKAAPEKLLPWLQGSIEKTPDQKSLWPLLARAYVLQKQYPEAREWFLKIWKDSDAGGALMAAGALSMQMEDRKLALELLDEIEKKEGVDKANEMRITYARIAEDEKRPLEAIEWYRKVDGGEGMWGAQLHLATLLAQNGKREEALELLVDLPAVTMEERIGVLQLHARILRETEDWEAAIKVLEKGIKDFPESVDLLLDLGLVEEKRGNLKSAEQHLRAALKLKPEEPYVQNALGYTLVDHKINIDEGSSLIEKAHHAMPEDGAILDSMGWARFRQGKNEEAVAYLQQAWEKHPDPEVAAHWGEVLWQLGRFDEARKAWALGLKLTPKDALILNTMKRLKVGELSPALSAP